MTAIQAAPGRLGKNVASGLRPFDIGRDLRPVAELIADAFAHELDSRGNAALREMRVMSHIGGFLKLLNRSTGEFDDVFGGFVWVEAGKVVGNVTVQRAESTGSRWQIANVAVAPAYRGRGISHQLMDQALTHINGNGGQWAVLQVYAKNTVARTLYANLGFEEMGGNIELRLDRLPKMEPPTPPANFYTFSSSHWQPLYELANHQHNAHAQWWRAIRRSDFQVTMEQQAAEWLWRSLGRNQVYRRCIQISQRFDAALVLTAARWRGIHQVQLWVRPEEYGQHEQSLLQWTMAVLQEYPRWPVQLNLSTAHGAALDVAQRFGFQIQQTLLTLRRKV
ncbi:MAG: GNAT family N-acetyltransferase [Chloroflexota bacterium]|nr:GNAT family N-acetyltransferase [Chloroflexota bacterium]